MCHIWSRSVQRFGIFPTFLNLWPPNPLPNAPWGLEPVNLFSLCPFPDESAYRCRIWSRSVQRFGIFTRTFLNLRPLNPLPNAPWGLEPVNLFSLCPFPDESAYVCRIWSRSVQLFGIFPTFLNLWPPNPLQMPLDVSRGYLLLTYIHSEMNLHTYAKFGPDRSSGLESFLDLWFVLPQKPPKMPPGLSWGKFF